MDQQSIDQLLKTMQEGHTAKERLERTLSVRNLTVGEIQNGVQTYVAETLLSNRVITLKVVDDKVYALFHDSETENWIYVKPLQR